MTPIQQLMLGAGGSSEKTYVDDVFSTNLWTGNGSVGRAITTGIDTSTDGGLVWIKERTGSEYHNLFDTVRGWDKLIYTNMNSSESDQSGGTRLRSFTTTGFTLGSDTSVNANGDFAGYSFKKTPGFLDIIKFTGNGSNRAISHSLGSVPGFILVKGLDNSYDWAVFHRGQTNPDQAGLYPWNYYLRINAGTQSTDSATIWNDTAPTASNFTIGTDVRVNENSKDYIAYVFAGGESTAATANSIDLDGTNDYLSAGSSSDFNMGTGDFTVECWVKSDDVTSQGIFQISPTSGGLQSSNYADTILAWVASDDTIKFAAAGAEQAPSLKAYNGQWFHVALVRNSGTTSLYVNGTLSKAVSDTTNYDGTYIAVGGYFSTSYTWGGHVSNFRVVKGTAVYTSSFRPPTEPLTNVTNTKLLCCQSSTDATAAAVTPGTITLNGTGQAHSTDSPFDDPAGFLFGKSRAEIIKCGSYIGNGSASFTTKRAINIGWEPQWIMIKAVNSSQSWFMMDSMREISDRTGDNLHDFLADNGRGEEDKDYLTLSSTGFDIKTGSDINTSNVKYIYFCIRRPDGHVGKPPELGTSVFAMDVGNGSSTIPTYDSGFPVDFMFRKNKTSTADWVASSRLTSELYLKPNQTNVEASYSDFTFDSDTGWGKDGGSTDLQAYMFKRHTGMEVVTYTGNGSNRTLIHNMAKIPEMMWVKNRTTSVTYGDWCVYHKGANGGTTPQNYRLKLNTSVDEEAHSYTWNNTAPTSTTFGLGSSGTINASGSLYIAILFASVAGVSSVGSWTGNGSATERTITLGFQPRFILVKNVTNNGHDWQVLDTARGWGSGNDKRLFINTTSAEVGTSDIGQPTATGFTLTTTNGSWNENNSTIIYYAHA